MAAIAVLIPVLVIGAIIYRYHRKHGRYPTFGRKRIVNEPSSVSIPRRSRRRGVWRPIDPEEGLPGYTTEASVGELSLGTGIKIRDDAEYELAESLGRSSGETRDTRTPSLGASMTEVNPPGTPPTRPAEVLPPYIPPPSPAFLAGGRSHGRRGSYQSQSRRTSFASVSRRSSRVE